MVVVMRAKENHVVMEDKWEPIIRGPTITGSMLETCKGRAVLKVGPREMEGTQRVSTLPQGGTSRTSLTQIWRS